MDLPKEFLKQLSNTKMQTLYPKNEIGKILFKLPIFLWRLGLGPIVGKILMIITHTGRKSGTPRQTMVEYHSMNGIKYVIAAFGVQTQWYRNILANPQVTIQTADGTEQMTAVRVTHDEELMAVVELFLHRDPPLMKWYLDSLEILPDRTSILANKDTIVFIRFDPTSAPTPRGLEVDLAWIWPALMLWGFVNRLFRRKK